MRVVYADVLILFNFCADFLVLYVVGSIFTLNKHLLRLCGGSILGVVYAFVCEIYLYNLPLLCMIVGIAIIPLICGFAYSFSSALAIAKQSGMFMLFSSLLDGGMQLLSRIIISIAGRDLLKNGISPLLFVILSCTMSLFTLVCIILFKRTNIHNMQIVSISTNGIQKHLFNLICDTGNKLTDINTGLLVIVMTKESLKKMNIELLSESCIMEFGIKYIPVVTACGNSVFACFKPKCIEIVMGKKRIPINAAVAFDNGGCTYNGADGVIPYELIQNI